MFELHPSLKKKTLLMEMALCSVLLEDDADYPWVILVPRRESCAKLIDLSITDQTQLMHEMNRVQLALWKEFNPTQLNVAAIGNKTAQLHVHIIVRFEGDPQWPQTVWDKPIKNRYTPEAKEAMIRKITTLFS